MYLLAMPSPTLSLRLPKNADDYFHFYLYVMKNEIDIELQAHIGRVLLNVQKFEYLVHGLVSHFKPELLDKTFMKGMTAKIFLSGEPADKKKRKQTLGQVFASLKHGAPFLYWDELDSYLESRNIFIHHFWRDYISKNFDPHKCKTFVSQLDTQTQEWTNVFRGLLSVMAKGIMSRTPDKVEDIKADLRYKDILANEPFEKFLYEKFGVIPGSKL